MSATAEARIRRHLLATVVLTSLLIVPGLPDPSNAPKEWLLVPCAAALAVEAVWLARLRPLRDWAPVAAAGLVVMGLAVAAIINTQQVYRTLYGVWGRADGLLTYVAFMVAFAVGSQVFRGQGLRAVETMAGLTAVETVLSIVQRAANAPLYVAKPYNPIMGTFSNPDFASAFLGIGSVALLHVAADRRRSSRLRAAAGVFSVAAVMLSILSDSLQGPLCAIIGVAVMGLIAIFDDACPLPLRWLRVWAPVAVAVVILSGIGAIFGRGPLREVLASGNLADRFYCWRAAIGMWRHSPVTGIGLDSYGDWYGVTRGPELLGGGAANPSTAAHSVPLQLLATGGLVVFVPYVLLLVFVAARAVKALRSGRDRGTLAALLGMWLAHVAQSMFSLDQLGIGIWGWVFAAAIVAHPLTDPPAAEDPNRHLGADGVTRGEGLAVSVAFLTACVLIAVPVQAHLSYLSESTAIDQAVASQRAASPGLAASAAMREPVLALAMILQLREAGFATTGLDIARSGAQRFPRDSQIAAQAADIAESRGDFRGALPYRVRSVALEPRLVAYAAQLAIDRSKAGVVTSAATS